MTTISAEIKQVERLVEGHPVKLKAQPYYLYRKENTTAVVLVHGFTGSPYDMKELAEFLHGHGVNVYAVRLAGHGTHVNDLARSTPKDWGQSVRDAVELVKNDHERVFLIGYSFGANIALNLVAREPELFAGIVCLGASIYLRYGKFYNFYYPLRWFGMKIFRKPYIPKRKIEIYEVGGNYAHVPIDSFRIFKHFIRDYTLKELVSVSTPILIIHSRDDRISHPRSAAFLFENISSQYKELFFLNELNHNPLRSENKDKIFSKVLSFIEQ